MAARPTAERARGWPAGWVAAGLIGVGAGYFAWRYWPHSDPIISGAAISTVFVLFLFAAWHLLLDVLGAPASLLTDGQRQRRAWIRTLGVPLALLAGLLFGHFKWA